MRWLVLAAAAMVLSGCGLPPIVTGALADRDGARRRPALRLPGLLDPRRAEDGLQEPLPPARGARAGRLAGRPGLIPGLSG